jgi:uncharacterized membrane protein YesL
MEAAKRLEPCPLDLRISCQYSHHTLLPKALVTYFVSILYGGISAPARVDFNLRVFPYLSGGILKAFKRLRENLAAVAWLVGHHVMTSTDQYWIPKVFVEVVDVLDDAIVDRAGDA